MKTKRFLLGLVIGIATAACARDATSPEPVLRAPGAVAPSTTEASEPVVVDPVEEPADDNGGVTGSGCCANR
jgi:hypothetical protein